MKPFWKYLLITLTSFILMGYLVFSIWNFSGRKQENVCGRLDISVDKSSGRQLITEQEVAEILNQNNLNPIGKTIKYIQTESIEDALRKNPMIKEAECYKTPSGIVNIRIVQRSPKFRVVGLGSYYIDNDRKPMPISPNFAAYVPVVSGRVTTSMATGELFDFVSFLEANPFWNAQIEQINVREDRKIELVPRVSDAIIVLGTLENYPNKLEKLHKLYEYGFKVMGWNKYKSIDLQYKDQVVCNKDEAVVMKNDSLITEKKDSIIVKKI